MKKTLTALLFSALIMFFGEARGAYVDLSEVKAYEGTLVVSAPEDIEVWVTITSEKTIQKYFIGNGNAVVEIKPFLLRTAVYSHDRKSGKTSQVVRFCQYPETAGWILRIGYDAEGLIFRCVFEYGK